MAVAAARAPIVDQVLFPANTPNPQFSFTPYLASVLPTIGTPSKHDKPICPDFRENENCPRGLSCPDRHFRPPSERTTLGTKNLICKHYQRGLCKKADLCDFNHGYNLRDERECKDYSRWVKQKFSKTSKQHTNMHRRYGVCAAGDDCTYLHVHPTSDLRRPACPHYARGFCPLGDMCAMRHIKHPKLCPFYMAGFCPNGRAHPPDVDKVVSCEFGAHAKWVDDSNIHPRKPEVRKPRDLEQEAREQEEREQEFFEEEMRAFERNAAGGMDARSRGGYRPRGRGRGRGRRY